jgi:inhibitor of cysteine peptidase
MGKRAYMVTFKKVDPLFVIDLAKPASPNVLGALKIPGYSDYLHPYDENHIIGFGKEAESDKDWAYYQGMKLALFDVSDVTKPKEKFKTVIGDRGTDSELLSNHKALLFSKENELLAFPVTVLEWTPEQKAKKDVRDYGQFTFQGAYVYRLNLQQGFTLTSTITHLTEEEMKKAGEGWYESENNVKRILTINDTLYTVSGGYVKAQNISTQRQQGTLSLTK